MESGVSQIFTTAAVTVVSAAVSAACALAVAYLKRGYTYMKRQADHVDDRMQRERFLQGLDLLDDVTTRTVEKLEQTVAGELRTLVKEGKANRDGLLQLGNQAWINVCHDLGDEWLKILEKGMGDLDSYIKSLIESKVLNLKKGQG